MLPLAAAGMVLAIVASALSIDLGRVANERRRNQKVADLAALDAAWDLSAVQPRAETSATRNRFEFTAAGTNPEAVRGFLAADGTFTPAAEGDTVRVIARSRIANAFVAGGHDVAATAFARIASRAVFSVGSTLVSIDTRKSILDPILGQMLGGATAVNLSAVSYDGLASGSVSLAALQTELAALGLDVGTPEKLLGTSMSAATLLRATATALERNGQALAAAEVNDIPINLLPNLNTVSLGQLVSLSQPSATGALDTSLNVFGLITGAAQLSNGTSFVSVPGLVVDVPLVGQVSFALRAIQPAQTASGPVGTQAKTSQVALRLSIDLLNLGVLLPPVHLDLDFEAASAVATLTQIRCSGSPGISLNATTAGATVKVNASAPLVGSLTAAGTLAGTAAGGDLSFEYPTQFAPPVGPPPAFSQHVGAATLNLSSVPPLTLTASSGALGLLAPLVLPLVPTILSTVTANPAVQTVLHPVLQTLGLDLAAADLTALAMLPPPPACGIPTLVR
ncbi:MAG: pilus assembly protein TadG-related protein [Acidimicrobiales bacterium]